MSCPALSSLSSGEISVTTDGTTSIARFACLEGYQLIGSGIVECTNDGTWNLSSPVCSKSTRNIIYTLVQNVSFHNMS